MSYSVCSKHLNREPDCPQCWPDNLEAELEHVKAENEIYIHALNSAKDENDSIKAECDQLREVYIADRDSAKTQYEELERVKAERDKWLEKFKAVSQEKGRQRLRAEKAEAQHDELLAACKAVVFTWENDFKGQETGYEGTPLEANYHQCKAATTNAEAKD